MGSVRFGIPRDLVLALKASYGISHFVETGTLVGDTTIWAAGHFSEVHTVDNDQGAQPAVLRRFAGFVNVHVTLSDSAEFLESHPITHPTLFWLDAHTNESCPVLREIAAINQSPLRNVILVDDYRLFGDLSAWPTVSQVSEALRDGDRRLLNVIDDVLVATPCP